VRQDALESGIATIAFVRDRWESAGTVALLLPTATACADLPGYRVTIQLDDDISDV
jgi:hypothetical protein